MEQINVNYKSKKRYNTARYPLRQSKFITWLIHFLCKIGLSQRQYKIEKIGMDGLKPPYFMLSNHQYFVDFQLADHVTYPHKVNNVINIDGYINRAWLMELIGGICTRKFSNDFHLIKSIMKVLKRGDVVGLYPEARYSACGITSYIPLSLAKMVKMAKVPVVVLIHHGNHLESPFWNFRKKRKVPLYTRAKLVLTKQQVETMSVNEIYEILLKEFEYDEYKYQKENNILIKEKYRAEGLHKILYKCPDCLQESKMDSKGSELYCKKCNARWNLNEDGSLSQIGKDSKFTHVPDWYNWERSIVKQEVINGTYSFEDDVEIYSMPNTSIKKLGKGSITHTIDEGFVLNGNYRKQPFRIIRKPLASNSLHVEYDYVHIKPYDCFCINCEDDSFFVYPKKENVITKIGFAVEEIYQYHLNKNK